MYHLNKIFDQIPSKVIKGILQKTNHEKLLMHSWNKILGKLSKEVSFSFLKGNQVFLTCQNPIWKTELLFHKKMILDKINACLPKPMMTEICVLIEKKNFTQEKKQKKNQYTLEEKIKKENRIKIEKGHQWCQTCHQVLTFEQNCVFCKNNLHKKI